MCLWKIIGGSPWAVAAVFLVPVVAFCFHRQRQRAEKFRAETAVYIRHFRTLDRIRNRISLYDMYLQASRGDSAAAAEGGAGAAEGGGDASEGARTGGITESEPPIQVLRHLEMTAAAGLLGHFGRPSRAGNASQTWSSSGTLVQVEQETIRGSSRSRPII